MKIPTEDVSASHRLSSLLKEVAQKSHENEVHYSGGSDDQMAKCFAEIRLQINEGILPVTKQLYNYAHKYDPCPEIKANGIRSWLSAVEKLAALLLQMAHHAYYKRNSYVFFRKAAFVYRVKVHTDYTVAVRNLLEIILRLTTVGDGSSVICDNHLDPTIDLEDVVDLISEMRQIDVSAFCGRTQCFHFCDSAQGVAQGILLAFATFSAAYGPVSPLQNAIHQQQQQQKTKQSSAGAGFLSLLSNPDVLSQQVLWALANFDLGFVKKFWLLGDNKLLLAGADWLIPSVFMSQGINLHSIPLKVQNNQGEEITIEPPSIFSGYKPIKCRLISDVLRSGQEYWLSSGNYYTPDAPPSDCIVFQIHGGGFICQSARAQEVYLRQLSCDTQVPFFCADYSLLPEDPFPRAVEEVTYAYCWMINNFSKLGTTGKRIVCIGDSAGGALLLSLCIRLIELEIRLPDSLCLVYPYACSSFSPSPSRLLALADPIVPIPLLIRCCCGYGNLSEHDARLVLGIGTPDHAHPSPLFPEANCNHDCCPETPIPASPEEGPSRRNSVSHESVLAPSVGQQTSRHRRSISAPNHFNVLSSSKSVGSALGTLAEDFPQHAHNHRHHHHLSHQRNKSDLGLWTTDLNFHRLRMSESERSTLADLLNLPIFSDPLFSPLAAPDDILMKLPPIHICGSTGDPLLDDGVVLCQKLRRLGRKCDFTVFEGVPHGFLNLHLVSRACADALGRVSNILQHMTGRNMAFNDDASVSSSVENLPILVETVERVEEGTPNGAASSIYRTTMNMVSSLGNFSMGTLKRRMFFSGGAGGDSGDD